MSLVIPLVLVIVVSLTTAKRKDWDTYFAVVGFLQAYLVNGLATDIVKVQLFISPQIYRELGRIMTQKLTKIIIIILSINELHQIIIINELDGRVF